MLKHEGCLKTGVYDYYCYCTMGVAKYNNNKINHESFPKPCSHKEKIGGRERERRVGRRDSEREAESE